MRLPCLRLIPRRPILAALGVLAMSAASPAAPPPGTGRHAPPQTMTLLGTLAEWKYPGSTMLGGASMSDGGNPSLVDVRCRAILTTPDAFEKVIAFYAEKLGTSPAAGKPGARAGAEPREGRAVSIQDDSEGRPVALRIIVVSKTDSTTTLVISRGQGEKDTHIAWTHYRWFDAVEK